MEPISFGLNVSQEVVLGLWIELTFIKFIIYTYCVVIFVDTIFLVWLKHSLEKVLLVPSLL